jgi:MoaA/NifB/PqqE/SkfB family radical SAM enzyme
MIPPFFNLDIEATNRCNAKCYFCPRDATPHQGLMSPEVFAQTLRRAEEFRDVVVDLYGTQLKVNLCGLGEPLLNRHTVDFVRQTRAAGFECSLTTNGALLDEARGRALLDAGLQGVEINVGEIDDEYEEIYKLPFERTRDNVVRFAEMAGDDCAVRVVLVDHRRDAEHLEAMKAYWRERGVTEFLPFEIMNRGGALFVDHMQYDGFAEQAEARSLLEDRIGDTICAVPFVLLFVGYDGQYYLCCSDWTKQAPLGSVFDASFFSVVQPKVDHVTSRDPVCRTCNLDPVNRVTEELRAIADGQSQPAALDALLAGIGEGIAVGKTVIADLGGLATAPGRTEAADAASRRLIPLRVT